MAIVKHVTRRQALTLGEEKAYAVARLLAATPKSDTVASIIAEGVRVGTTKHRAQDMPARGIDAAKRTITRAAAPRDPVERAAQPKARAAHARLRAKGVTAKIDAVKWEGQW